MKKKLLAILLCITCAVALACGTVGFAAAEIQRSLSDEQIERLNGYAAEMNTHLAELGTTVEEQLARMEERYSTLSATVGGENIRRMSKLTKELRQSNHNYTPCSLSDAILDGVLAGLNATARTTVIALLTPAFALFEALDWYLTGELMVHSIDPYTSPNEVYKPVYGYLVRETEQFKKYSESSTLINNGNGAFEFPKINIFKLNRLKGVNADLAMAIHGFNFHKPADSKSIDKHDEPASYSSKTVIITDIYDYKRESGYPTIVKFAVNAMVALHDMGLSTWYPLEIAETPYSETKYVNEYYGYDEYKRSFLAEELIDYKVQFKTSGSRLVQTFGEFETSLSVLEENGKPIARAEGNGYAGNSLISCYFEANKFYLIRVVAKDKTLAGYGKVSIFCDGRQAESAKKLNLLKLQTGETYSGSAVPNNMYMAEFTPTVSATYKIKFTSQSNYRAYLVQTDETYAYNCTYNNKIGINNSNNTLSFKPPKPWVDQIIDIGGGSGEADTIYQKINAGQTFVLAVCAYSANTSSTNFAFIIRK